MKIKKGRWTFAVKDSIGQVVSAAVIHCNGCCILLHQLSRENLMRRRKENETLVGIPMYFAIDGDIGVEKSEFLLYPAADNDMELKFRYYPAMKEA